ncbi:hypothetical protein BK718_00565 [Bacillus thuringiensis serovar andalousiensis]|uniref:AAA+ ATPase domain-containing protein n=3 Tax=Bacillus cereus group TaxID=86661 RepID=A0A9X6K8T2_BACTU|nr:MULTISPECIES: AAA family ATPase [Bacillus cereus group]MDA2615572.1 AAA family ATPase [Bacillus cereus]MEB8553952.1 AAA family ATPase [Bacillus cereus]MEB8728948.1 AAA family ATPase [Bacillus cereus]MEB8824113.1 AAA family ATPase [Bacillus cereus]MEB8976607.1 AAA family ATPase [Bacillus cereus]
MTDFFVFEGPDTAFNTFTEEHRVYEGFKRFPLKELAKNLDKVSLDTILVSIKEQNEDEEIVLVAKTEDFFSFRDHFIDNLPYLIYSWIQLGYISHAVIQNPPKNFIKGLESLKHSEQCVGVMKEKYKREPLTKNYLRKVALTFNEKILGQDSVLKQMITALYPLINKQSSKPIVLMFYGPPGVGKTESAKIINNCISSAPLCRQQLSMFKANEFYNYFFGGEMGGKALTKDLIRNEGNVILLDEFSQCPPDFYSAFFQIFDEGIYEDNNYKVDLTNTIIICTSNFNSVKEIHDTIGSALYSRFTHFIKFNHLDTASKTRLVSKFYEEVLMEFSKEDVEYLHKKDLKSFLLTNVDRFTNVRNIENSVKMFVYKELTEIFLEEIFSSTIDQKY